MELQECETRLQKRFKKCGFEENQAERIADADLNPQLSSMNYDTMRKKLLDVCSKDGSLVILLLRSPDIPAYCTFKNLTDRVVPIQSICMTTKAGKHVDEKITNIMMKVNLKFAGNNHAVSGVADWLRTTMVVGADLVDPGTGAFPGTPSIAAIVASVDPSSGKCLGSLTHTRLIGR